MKKTLSYILVAAAAFLLQGCIEDSRENFMTPDSVGLAYEEQVVAVSVYAGSHTVTVLKAGKGTAAGYVELSHGSDALKAYNASDANYTKYTEIAASNVRYGETRLQFAEKDVRQNMVVEWDPAKLVPLLGDELHVIPVAISGSDIEINDSRSLLLLNILNSTASFASSGSTVTAKEEKTEKGEVQVKFKLDHPLPKDITIRYSVDNSLVATYNAEKGTNYGQAPAAYVAAGEAVIKAGATDVFVTIPLNTEALFSGNKMMDFRTFVVPLKISGTSVDGVIVSAKPYYLLVNSPFAGASFSRIWGRYSTESLWMLPFGLVTGADRNLALDADWVYLPYAVGGSTAKVTAISVNDPETTKEVNTTGFKTATITTACVRVIDKGNGTSMLVASGAAENDFPFYAWENGIDNPPTVYSLQCTWRRGGDRFEYHGTWADGTLYVHSYVGTFTTSYKVENGAFVKTDRTLVDMPYTGFGGLYPYPGQDQMVFSTSDASAFVTLTGGTHKAGDGQDIYDTDREDFPGADMTWGYRCFTFMGEKYIAYTAVDKDDDLKEDGITTYTTRMRARLVVVKDKGGFKASLLGDDKDIVFEAPLQGEEFSDIAIAAPMSVQGDCAVCVLGDKVLIAAGVQGIGLSIFKME